MCNEGDSERISEVVDNMIVEDQLNLHHFEGIQVDVTNSFVTDEVS